MSISQCIYVSNPQYEVRYAYYKSQHLLLSTLGKGKAKSTLSAQIPPILLQVIRKRNVEMHNCFGISSEIHLKWGGELIK